MGDTLSSLIQPHRAFYEVCPYYVVVDGADESRTIQAGFDVDVYGESLKKEITIPGPDPDYIVANTELQKIANKISQHATHSCTLEVINFPSTVFFDLRRSLKAEGRLCIRISHWRGLTEPAGLPEQRALEELEKELRGLGLARR